MLLLAQVLVNQPQYSLLRDWQFWLVAAGAVLVIAAIARFANVGAVRRFLNEM